jgi:hypothetical protein
VEEEKLFDALGILLLSNSPELTVLVVVDVDENFNQATTSLD